MFSTAIKGWKLAAKAFSGEGKSYCRKQQYKSCWHACMHPHFASKWFKKLYSSEYIHIATHRPRLYLKPFRVYMSTRWDRQQKVKVILDTYEFIQNKGLNFIQAIIDEKHFLTATFRLRDESGASIVLGYDERYRKEGELVLTLQCEKFGNAIAGASFSFENTQNEGWICRIGCIQGYKNKDVNIVKTLQNLMNGLRPKALMVFAVQEFAGQLGIKSVYGAGQSIQAFRRKHAVYIPWFHKISFDYDKLWMESGGSLTKDGWFLLPTIAQRKSMCELKPSKRAAHKRRYEMMDQISAEIHHTVQCLIASN